eukprot:3712765-Rhodomonas_salina.1
MPGQSCAPSQPHPGSPTCREHEPLSTRDASVPLQTAAKATSSSRTKQKKHRQHGVFVQIADPPCVEPEAHFGGVSWNPCLHLVSGCEAQEFGTGRGLHDDANERTQR